MLEYNGISADPESEIIVSSGSDEVLTDVWHRKWILTMPLHETIAKSNDVKRLMDTQHQYLSKRLKNGTYGKG